MWHMRLHHFCHLSLQKRDAWWERLRTMRDRNWYLKLIGDWQTHQKKHQNQTVLASLCHLIIKIQSHLWSMAIRDVSQLLLTTISSPENITNYHLPHLFKSSKFFPPPPRPTKKGARPSDVEDSKAPNIQWYDCIHIWRGSQKKYMKKYVIPTAPRASISCP